MARSVPWATTHSAPPPTLTTSSMPERVTACQEFGLATVIVPDIAQLESAVPTAVATTV